MPAGGMLEVRTAAHNGSVEIEVAERATELNVSTSIKFSIRSSRRNQEEEAQVWD